MSLPVPTYTPPRKRSSSKTLQNFHPINSTPISDLTKLDDTNTSAVSEFDIDDKLIDSELSLDLNSKLGPQLAISSSSPPSSASSISSDGSASSSISSSILSTPSPLSEEPISASDLTLSSSSSTSASKIKLKSTKPQKPLSLITDINQKDPINSVITPIHKPASISSSSTSISTLNQPTKSILLRKPLPASDSKLKSTNKVSTSSTSSSSSNTTSLPIPNLKKFVHVVRLISPDQPDEYLKVLNIPIYPDTLKIGRQNTPKTSNKITDGFFDSRVLSRNHAELFIKDNELFIRDLKSSNGTFINDVKLEPYKDYKISINDKIDLGTTLESQMAHKKITCIIKEFDYISLKNFENLIEEINNKDDLINKKMELFNNTFDALLFGEIVDDIILGVDDSNELNLNDDLLDLIMTNNNKPNPTQQQQTPVKFVQGLDLKPSQNPQDVVKKLITAVNNEYIQQQRLKEMNIFLKNYNNSVAGYENNSIFKLYDKLLRNEKEIGLISTPPISPNLKQIKYNRMEDQLKNSMAELDIVRQHLSTAKSNEYKMKKVGIENESLKKMLTSSESKINELQDQLESARKDNEVCQAKMKEVMEMLDELEKKNEAKELEAKEIATKEIEKEEELESVDKHEEVNSKELEVEETSGETVVDIPVDSPQSKGKPDDEINDLAHNVKNILQGLSSNAVKYSGWIILSVALIYYNTPIAVQSISDLISS